MFLHCVLRAVCSLLWGPAPLEAPLNCDSYRASSTPSTPSTPSLDPLVGPARPVTNNLLDALSLRTFYSGLYSRPYAARRLQCVTRNCDQTGLHHRIEVHRRRYRIGSIYKPRSRYPGDPIIRCSPPELTHPGVPSSNSPEFTSLVARIS